MLLHTETDGFENIDGYVNQSLNYHAEAHKVGIGIGYNIANMIYGLLAKIVSRRKIQFLRRPGETQSCFRAQTVNVYLYDIVNDCGEM